MSLRKVLGKIFIFGILEIGALAGAVTPEQIEQVMKLSEPAVVHVVKKDRDKEPTAVP